MVCNRKKKVAKGADHPYEKLIRDCLIAVFCRPWSYSTSPLVLAFEPFESSLICLKAIADIELLLIGISYSRLVRESRTSKASLVAGIP